VAALLDVNVLLALATDRHPHCAAAAAWMETLDAGQAVVCRVAQSGLMRLLNNPAVMQDEVLDTTRCWAVWRGFLQDERVQFALTEPPGLDEAFERFTRDHPFSPKLWTDAYLAAYAVTAQLQLATFDAGFRDFPGVEIETLG
jgi:toxin-antitoxin system PIN domain toxin